MFILALVSICTAMICNLTVGLTLQADDEQSTSSKFLIYSPIGALVFLLVGLAMSSVLIPFLLAIPLLLFCAISHGHALSHLGSMPDAVAGLISNALCMAYLILGLVNAL